MPQIFFFILAAMWGWAAAGKGMFIFVAGVTYILCLQWIYGKKEWLP